MRTVAELGETQLRELFSETAAKMGITPAAVEKDFWLCWVLMIIFEHSDLSKILKLKGGTSLSKCYNLIDRFSEDIDLILDWTVLTDEDPNEKRTNTKQNIFNQKLNQRAKEYNLNKLLPILKVAVSPLCNAEIDVHDGHTINIGYPSSFSNLYLRPEIKLEIAPLGSLIPSTEKYVSPYVAEIFPERFENRSTTVNSIKVERTFWEKVTILHAEAMKEGAPKYRYSRHYYDVYKMLGTKVEENALQDLELLEQVVRFKKQFYYSEGAKYDLAKPGKMRLIPENNDIELLNDDYVKMREMIFGEYPDFDLIISKHGELETKINNLDAVS